MSLAIEEQDDGTVDMVEEALIEHEKSLHTLEFARMFSGKMDANAAFLDINSGSGGTEAQDWAEMLLRMYLRWAEAKGFKAEVIELSQGDVAGIKSATVHVQGPYAFGWLRTETGVHRLVRKSPFDSGNRRHTSFASISSLPRLTMILKLKSILLICPLILIVHRVRAGSMLTKQILLYGSRITPRAL